MAGSGSGWSLHDIERGLKVTTGSTAASLLAPAAAAAELEDVDPVAAASSTSLKDRLRARSWSSSFPTAARDIGSATAIIV
jgi:hypothetical protein